MARKTDIIDLTKIIPRKSKKTNVLYFDLVPWHEEVCYGVVDYLERIGCNITVCLNNEKYCERTVGDMFSSDITCYFLSVDEIVSFVKNSIEKFDAVVWGTIGSEEEGGYENRHVNDLLEICANRKTFGISHLYENCPQNIKELFSGRRIFTLTLGTSDARPLPMVGFGSKIRNEFQRTNGEEFSRKILLASRGSPFSRTHVSEFINMINGHNEISAFVTRNKYVSPLTNDIGENINLLSYLKYHDLLVISNLCSFIYIPVEYPKDGVAKYASGSFQLARFLGLVPIFPVSGVPFGFPDDCCVPFSSNQELVQKISTITQEEYQDKLTKLKHHSEELMSLGMNSILQAFQK